MNKLKLLTIFTLSLALLTSFLMLHPRPAAAYNPTDYLMDDSVFRNAYTMSATDILHFLQQEGSGLANFQDVYVCGYPSGKNFAADNQHYDCSVAVNDGHGGTYYQTQPQTAALIIAEASQAYGINPQAVLATLQKEQSLVTTPNPTSSQLNFAMGWGCPDTGGCSTAGFFNQVDIGTWQFRADMELGSGNNWWGFTPANYPCNGTTRYYSAALKAGNTVTFFDDNGTAYTTITLANMSTATLYCYTPHVYNNPNGLYGLPRYGTTGQYYSGSYNFYFYFSLWFGNNTSPYAFKGSSSDTVYFYINGYKVSVPAMSVVQDYGVAPNAIHTIDQSTADSIPAPSDGTSTTLGTLIKSPSDSDADGGALYLVTIGKRYQIQSMTQLADFGYSTANITYEPLNFIQSIPSGGLLSSFVTAPRGSVFQVTGGNKHLIFDFDKYKSLNPSDQISALSYAAINQLPAGMPLSSTYINVKYANDSSVYLFDNATYYSIPTFNVYTCWSFENLLHVPVVTLPDSSYIPAISPAYALDCFVNNSSSLTLVSKTVRYSVPSGYGFNRSRVDSNDIINLASKLPAVSTPLKQYVQPSGSAGIWFLTGGSGRVVPTYSDYVLLGLDSTKFDLVDSSAFASINQTGIKLGPGQVVKTDNSTSVYAISGDTRVSYPNADDFLGFMNSWNAIETYPATTLDFYYPYQNVLVSQYFYDQASNKTYFMDPNGCYYLDTNLLTDYGKNQSTIASGQVYNSSIFPSLNLLTCKTGSQYVKDPTAAAVYLINNGQKQQFSSWDSLVNYSHQQNPNIINLSTINLASFPTGPSI